MGAGNVNEKMQIVLSSLSTLLYKSSGASCLWKRESNKQQKHWYILKTGQMVNLSLKGEAKTLLEFYLDPSYRISNMISTEETIERLEKTWWSHVFMKWCHPSRAANSLREVMKNQNTRYTRAGDLPGFPHFLGDWRAHRINYW